VTATKPVKFTASCAVFAASEAVLRIVEGALPADIFAGIYRERTEPAGRERAATVKYLVLMPDKLFGPSGSAPWL
jgi:activator of 2-hydroxyglutaryl-CoA dehydratase